LVAFVSLAVLVSCQLEPESAPGASTCSTPSTEMYDSFNLNVQPILQAVCLSCHRIDGEGKKLTFLPSTNAENIRVNFCVSYLAGPHHKARILSHFPLTQAHADLSERVFTTSDIQGIVNWVDQYAE
jgi:hypothetical protein